MAQQTHDGAALPPGRAPRRAASTTRAFTVGSAEGYLTVSLAPDGTPAGVEVLMAKQGSTLAGLLDAFSLTLTRGLRGGIPLETFLADCLATRFEPDGATNDAEIRRATSVLDYVARRMALDWLPQDKRAALGIGNAQPPPA